MSLLTRARDVPRFWAALLTCLAVAIWIDLSGMHRYHNSDSYIPILVSLYRWAPYYWMQSRYGMLVPFLALPFHDPFTNLLVQNGIDAFAGAVSFFLLSRYLIPDRAWYLVGTAALASFLLVFSPYPSYVYLSSCSYMGTSAALGLGGLLLIDHGSRPRWWCLLLALPLLLSAFWVNLSVVLPLGFLVISRCLVEWQKLRGWPLRRRLAEAVRLPPLIALALLAVSYRAGGWFAATASTPTTT